MKRNVGHPLDVWARVIVGIGLLSLIFLLDGNARWLGLIGIVPILTAIFGWCPTWSLLGIDTARKP